MSKDQELSNLKENVLNGNIYDTEISVQEGILFRGQRVIIPKTLQPAVLKELHSTHVGIVKMKALARNYCYWKNIDKDIENMVKSCKDCCDVKKDPSKAPIHNWEIPTRNWQRVHLDYAGPFLNHYFLIVVDAKSKWPEIYHMQKAPDSAKTIHYLREIFSRHGLPELLVSDNATIFKSQEFQDFCHRNGIRQRLIAPGHPATNGQAERYCQTLKTKLKCMRFQPGTLHEKLCELLFRYRATPLANGKTPAELMIGQNLRTKLDLIKPQSPDFYKNFSPQPEFNKHYKVGERVQSRNYASSNLWKYGTVVERLGRVHYLIELDDGYVIKRHYNQLRRCQVEKQIIHSPIHRVPRHVSFKSSDEPVGEQNTTTETSVQTESPVSTFSPRISTPQSSNRYPSSSPSSSRIPDPISSSQNSSSSQLRRSSRMRKTVQRLNI